MENDQANTEAMYLMVGLFNDSERSFSQFRLLFPHGINVLVVKQFILFLWENVFSRFGVVPGLGFSSTNRLSGNSGQNRNASCVTSSGTRTAVAGGALVVMMLK